jgi:hypothetical protein
LSALGAGVRGASALLASGTGLILDGKPQKRCCRKMVLLPLRRAWSQAHFAEKAFQFHKTSTATVLRL